MIATKRLRLILLLLLPCTHVFAQYGSRVHVSNEDPLWRATITISYVAPESSEFSREETTDTLYCAAVVTGVRPEHAIVFPMNRVNDTLYTAQFAVPDSTYSLRIEICTPKDRVPDGIVGFTCRTSDGRPTPGYLIDEGKNIDSALTLDLAEYPTHYAAYVAAYDMRQELASAGAIAISDSSWGPWVKALILRLQAKPDNTASWHLALASLYMRSGRDSLANISLSNAAACATYDPIYNDANFCNHFFAPRMSEGKLSFPVEPARILSPVVARFPHTTMAARWIRMIAFDTLMPVTTWQRVTAEWSSSHDVDILHSIAQGYGYRMGPAHNLDAALQWCNRAEHAWTSQAGFYSGENIYGSMGRIGGILATKIELLARVGRIDEAISTGHAAATVSTEPYEKQMIAAALGNAYLEAGMIEDAKRTFGIALAQSTRGSVDGLDSLYKKCKEGNETEKEFAQRLIKTYGKTASLELPVIPDFSYTSLDGKTGSLSSLHGKVVLIDCWFTTCGGCIVEKESLNRLVDSYAGDTNVVFLSIALNDTTTLQQYFMKHARSKFIVVPNGYDICKKLGVTGYPTHIVIGRDGKTLGYDLGGSEKQDELMRPKIEEALGAK